MKDRAIFWDICPEVLHQPLYESYFGGSTFKEIRVQYSSGYDCHYGAHQKQTVHDLHPHCHEGILMYRQMPPGLHLVGSVVVQYVVNHVGLVFC
jgi:hypothetical protein